MIRAGLIGCGFIANKHIKTIARLDELEIVAMSDIDRNKMIKARNFYKQLTDNDEEVYLYTDYNDLLLQEEIDVIIIAVYSGLHAKIAKKALKHKKHVIIEKPLALSMKDIDKVIQLSEVYNQKVFVCHQLRYRPLFKEIKALLEEGYFGDIYYIVASLRLNRTLTYYTSSSWKGTLGRDGGMLVNQGIHLIDLILWMMGDVTSVYGEVMREVKEKETEDIALGILSFEHGKKGLLEANTITKPASLGSYLSIFGSDGTVCIGGKNASTLEHCYSKSKPDIANHLQSKGEDLDEHYYMYNDFLAAMKEEGNNAVIAKEARKTMEAIFAVYLSAKKERQISLPISNFSF